MPIKVGDQLPSAKFRVMSAEGPAWKTTDEVFKGKKVALFAVPGAFTGTCHKMHVPSIVQNLAAIKAKGVDTVAVDNGTVKVLNVEESPGKVEVSGGDALLKAL
jgi:peroxiredoxin